MKTQWFSSLYCFPCLLNPMILISQVFTKALSICEISVIVVGYLTKLHIWLTIENMSCFQVYLWIVAYFLSHGSKRFFNLKLASELWSCPLHPHHEMCSIITFQTGNSSKFERKRHNMVRQLKRKGAKYNVRFMATNRRSKEFMREIWKRISRKKGNQCLSMMCGVVRNVYR